MFGNFKFFGSQGPGFIEDQFEVVHISVNDLGDGLEGRTGAEMGLGYVGITGNGLGGFIEGRGTAWRGLEGWISMEFGLGGNHISHVDHNLETSKRRKLLF